MKAISSNLIESLKTFGLTEYEAKVYSALVLFDRAEVKQIYEFLDAPKPSVYQSLKTLTDKGLVQVVNARPALYRATPPKIAIKHLTEVHRKAEDIAMLELEELEKSRVSEEYPNIIWTLYGNENIEHKVEEILGRVNGSLKAIIPVDFLDYLEILRNKDLDIRLITFGPDACDAAKNKYGLKNATTHDASSLDLSDLMPVVKYIADLPISPGQFRNVLVLIADDDEALYIPPIPGTVKSGVTTQNPVVVSLAGIMFRILWERTTLNGNFRGLPRTEPDR